MSRSVRIKLRGVRWRDSVSLVNGGPTIKILKKKVLLLLAINIIACLKVVYICNSFGKTEFTKHPGPLRDLEGCIKLICAIHFHEIFKNLDVTII